MKRPLLAAMMIIALTLSGMTARSQILISILLGDKLNNGSIEFGLTGGFNRTWMYQTENAEGINHFNLGFYFDFRLKKDMPWYIYTGVLVKSEMGASNIDLYPLNDPEVDSAMVGGSINRYIRYFMVPITVKYRFKNNIFVLAGGQVSLRHKATDEFTNSTFDDNDLVLKYKTKDNYRRLDAGLTAAAGYKFRYGAMMNIGMRYYYGLADVFKSGTGLGYATNSALFVFAEIPIGAERKTRPPKE